MLTLGIARRGGVGGRCSTSTTARASEATTVSLSPTVGGAALSVAGRF